MLLNFLSRFLPFICVKRHRRDSADNGDDNDDDNDADDDDDDAQRQEAMDDAAAVADAGVAHVTSPRHVDGRRRRRERDGLERRARQASSSLRRLSYAPSPLPTSIAEPLSFLSYVCLLQV